MWEQSDLTQDQRDELLKVRATYPEYPDWRKCRYKYCKMLVFDGRLATCLPHKIYGYMAKPKLCRDYPKKGRLCYYHRDKVDKMFKAP